MFFWAGLRTTKREPLDFFQQGVTARAKGKPRLDNPHCAETEAHTEWLEGWRATFDLDEDDDCDSCRDRSDRLTLRDR